MARPNKQGVDYFPLDVHLDDKFKFIEIKYKLEGFAILVKLLQKIYSYGYWYKWTEDEALLFSDELRADFETVNNVVKECLQRNVFDKDLYEKYSVLTSKGIQKRYKEIVRRRKDVEVTEEYLLIDNSFGVNDVINPTEGEQDDVKSTQSKVKESKGKEKEKENIYRQFKHLSITEKEFERLIGEGYTKDHIDDVLDRIENYAKNKNFVSLVMTARNWMKEDLKRRPPKKVEVTETELQKLLREKAKIEKELSEGKESYEVFGNLHVYEFHQKELKRINERLRGFEKED